MRSMDYSHEPGILFFKMKQGFLESLIDDTENKVRRAAIGIVDQNGIFCIEHYPQDFEMSDDTKKAIVSLAQKQTEDVILNERQVPGEFSRHTARRTAAC